MNITKNNKYLPDQSLRHQNISLLISSDLEAAALTKILSNNSKLINKSDNKDETFLSYALRRKKFDVCSTILSNPELDLSFKNKNGNTYLHTATESQCYMVVKELINRGLDINAQNNQGNTPLHLAIMNNDDLIRQLLMDNGADDSIKNNNEMTPEMLNDVIKDPFAEEDVIQKNCSDLLFNNSDEKNKSLKLDWSDGNINPKLCISSLKSNEEYYAKSFINRDNNFIYLKTKHNNVISSIDTRYNSGERTNNNGDNCGNAINNFASDRLDYNNEEADEDLFNLTNSNDSKDGDNNDVVKKRICRKINEDYNEEEDLVNTRYSAYGLNDIKQKESIQRDNVMITKAKTEEMKESTKSFQTNKIEGTSTFSFNKQNTQDKILQDTNHDKIPIEVENNFVFSSPNMDLQNHTSPPTASKPKENQDKKDNSNQLHKSDLYSFLSSIKMEQYNNNLISSGFDDLKLLIEQTKTGIGITDSNLKEAGVDLPGDRAKILIKLQEISGNFKYDIPKGVYHKCEDLVNCLNDFNVLKLSKWLSILKIECYLNNFISNGYHSLELLQMQMESKQPLTNEILLDEIHIDKLGYRTRILNKLKEDGRTLGNKLKTTTVVIEKKDKEEICDCRLF